MWKFNNRPLLGALAGVLLASLPISEVAAQAGSSGVKNVVLVHGAFADGSGWAKIIPLLEAKGLHVIAVQNPLTSLADDVAAAKRAIALQDGPVLLVGHSWGGAVITEAGNDPKVAGLLYVATAAPNQGQTFGEAIQSNPPAPGAQEIKADAAGFLSLTPKGMTQHFAQDLPAAEAKLMYDTQGPCAAAAFQDKISTAAWQTKPSWYIVAGQDHMIAPSLQQAAAKKIKATTLTLPTSHVPMASQPDKVAAFIVQAASKVKVQ